MNAAKPRVYLDSNVFIAAYENPGAISDHAWWIIEAIEKDQIEAVTSELTLAEILVKPIAAEDRVLLEGYEQILQSNGSFSVLPVERDVLIDAARLRALTAGLRTPDAIHLATASKLACTIFVSGDRRLRGSGEIRILPLGPFTLDDILGSGP
jgi:predicted nucleic acid-binding protein